VNGILQAKHSEFIFGGGSALALETFLLKKKKRKEIHNEEHQLEK